MKRNAFLLLSLLLIISLIATGCSKSNKNENNSSETVENVEDINDEEVNGDTSEFGIPLETDEYVLFDKKTIEAFAEEDPSIIEELNSLLGVSCYFMIGDYNGADFVIYSEENEAFIFKSIDIGEDDVLRIVLKKAKPGEQYAHESAYVVINKPFKEVNIQYEDGTIVKNVSEMYLETIYALFKSVDFENKTISIIPEDATVLYTYPYENIPEDILKELNEDDIVEVIKCKYDERTVYTIRKVEVTEEIKELFN